MRKHVFLAASGLALALSFTARAEDTGGTATYWISAETVSGMATGQMGGASEHRLALQLGSDHRTAAPQGEHFVPAGLKAGASLPLAATAHRGGSAGSGATASMAGQIKGRIRYMWGCGEALAPGHSRTIDLAAAGANSFDGVRARDIRELAAAQFASYAEWPDPQNSREISGSGSLVGAHRVTANYATGFAFDLGSDGDFLAPLVVRQNAAGAGGRANRLDWQGVERATGYVLSAIGASADGTVVMWSSSDVALQDMLIAAIFPTPKWRG